MYLVDDHAHFWATPACNARREDHGDLLSGDAVACGLQCTNCNCTVWRTLKTESIVDHNLQHRRRQRVTVVFTLRVARRCQQHSHNLNPAKINNVHVHTHILTLRCKPTNIKYKFDRYNNAKHIGVLAYTYTSNHFLTMLAVTSPFKEHISNVLLCVLLEEIA